MIWCKKYIRLLTVVKMKLLSDITAAVVAAACFTKECDSKSIISSYYSQKFHMLKALFNNVVILLNCYVLTLCCFIMKKVNARTIMNFTTTLTSLTVNFIVIRLIRKDKKLKLHHRRHHLFDMNTNLVKLILLIWILPFTSTHEINHSPNIIKTKYGLLRGVILKHEPFIEGYLGIPYGEF